MSGSAKDAMSPLHQGTPRKESDWELAKKHPDGFEAGARLIAAGIEVDEEVEAIGADEYRIKTNLETKIKIDEVDGKPVRRTVKDILGAQPELKDKVAEYLFKMDVKRLTKLSDEVAAKNKRVQSGQISLETHDQGGESGKNDSEHIKGDENDITTSPAHDSSFSMNLRTPKKRAFSTSDDEAGEEDSEVDEGYEVKAGETESTRKKRKTSTKKKLRCLRCKKQKKGCNLDEEGRPCKRCAASGRGADQCLSEA